jgi:hypothetical protein
MEDDGMLLQCDWIAKANPNCVFVTEMQINPAINELLVPEHARTATNWPPPNAGGASS